MISLGLLLKFLRKRKGFTQEKVAKFCNVSSKAISRYETGRAEPDFETLKKLVNLYNINMNEIFRKAHTTDSNSALKLSAEEFELIEKIRKCGKRTKNITKKMIAILMENEESYSHEE